MPPETLDDPTDVRAGPAHRNPYPFYARLARKRPVFRDPERGYWVVAGAAAVREVLENTRCWTRPAVDPIPAAIRTGAMAELFGRLVRLRDDPARDLMKRAIVTTLRRLDFELVTTAARARAAELDAEISMPFDEARLTRFVLSLPVQTLARLMGVPNAQLGESMTWLGDYGTATAAIATGVPSPNPDLVQRGRDGARTLLDYMRDLMSKPLDRAPLLASFVDEARKAGCTDENEIAANAIGLLLQGYASISALIGATLLALGRDSTLHARVRSDRRLLRPLIQEVLRCDPPTNSTIRFVAADGVIAGQQMHAGDMIIVLIAAANRDPALNADPDRFDIDRADRRYCEFGAGAHACPADKLAPLIAEIAVAHIIEHGVPLDRLDQAVSYAASAHLRTALFHRQENVR